MVHNNDFIIPVDVEVCMSLNLSLAKSSSTSVVKMGLWFIKLGSLIFANVKTKATT